MTRRPCLSAIMPCGLFLSTSTCVLRAATTDWTFWRSPSTCMTYWRNTVSAMDLMLCRYRVTCHRTITTITCCDRRLNQPIHAVSIGSYSRIDAIVCIIRYIRCIGTDKHLKPPYFNATFELFVYIANGMNRTQLSCICNYRFVLYVVFRELLSEAAQRWTTAACSHLMWDNESWDWRTLTSVSICGYTWGSLTFWKPFWRQFFGLCDVHVHVLLLY